MNYWIQSYGIRASWHEFTRLVPDHQLPLEHLQIISALEWDWTCLINVLTRVNKSSSARNIQWTAFETSKLSFTIFTIVHILLCKVELDTLISKLQRSTLSKFKFFALSNTQNELSPSEYVLCVASMLSEFHFFFLFNSIQRTKSASHSRNLSLVCRILHPHLHAASLRLLQERNATHTGTSGIKSLSDDRKQLTMIRPSGKLQSRAICPQDSNHLREGQDARDDARHTAPYPASTVLVSLIFPRRLNSSLWGKCLSSHLP